MLTHVLPDLSLASIDLRDSSSFALSDLSVYANVPGSTQRALQITPPGYDTINVSFTPQNVNVYKCVDLGITCSDSGCTPLPDGIYNVVYSVTAVGNSPAASIDLKFIKIDLIKCKYQHAFLKVDLECGCNTPNYSKYMTELQQIKLYIDGSVAECNTGNYKLSYEFYNKANKMLDKLSCKFPNSNWKSCNC
jgi:hypothetical protein